MALALTINRFRSSLQNQAEPAIVNVRVNKEKKMEAKANKAKNNDKKGKGHQR